MLDDLIIKDIEKRKIEDQPQLELPIPEPIHNSNKKEYIEEKRVIIIDLLEEELDNVIII